MHVVVRPDYNEHDIDYDFTLVKLARPVEGDVWGPSLNRSILSCGVIRAMRRRMAILNSLPLFQHSDPAEPLNH